MDAKPSPNRKKSMKKMLNQLMMITISRAHQRTPIQAPPRPQKPKLSSGHPKIRQTAPTSYPNHQKRVPYLKSGVNMRHRHNCLKHKCHALKKTSTQIPLERSAVHLPLKSTGAIRRNQKKENILEPRKPLHYT